MAEGAGSGGVDELGINSDSLTLIRPYKFSPVPLPRIWLRPEEGVCLA